MVTETEVTVQLKQYGKYGKFTDKLMMTHLDETILREVKRFGDQGARSIDTAVREELATCTNVIYAGGKTSRGTLTAAAQADQHRTAQGGAPAQEEQRAEIRRLLHRHRRAGHDL